MRTRTGFLCAAVGALLAGVATPARAQAYHLGIQYELPKNPDLAGDARLAESRCMDHRTVVLQSCANGGNAAQCERSGEMSFRECISAIPGAHFTFYIWQEGERSAHFLFDLKPEEAISSSLDQNFSHVQPGNTVYNLGVEAVVSGDSCRFQKSGDGTAVDVPDSYFFCAVVKDYAETNGAPPLLVAVNWHQNGVVRELLDRGVTDSSRGMSALRYAAREGNAMQVQLFYEHGSYSQRELSWALSDAVCADSPETVAYLVEHGADAGKALQDAAKCGNGEAVRYLLAHGADVKDVNLPRIFPCLPESPCAVAAKMVPFRGARDPEGIPESKKMPRAEMIKYLAMHGADVNAEAGSRGMKAGVLDFAARYDSLDLVRWLVEHGALVNGKDPRTVDGMSQDFYSGSGSIPSLCEAIEGGHWDTATYLMEQGAYVNLPCSQMELKTPLGLAVERNRPDMAQLFLTKGKFEYAQPEVGGDWIDLIWAAKTGREDFVRLLLQHGVRVDAPPGGWTALMEAAYLGNEEMARFLLAQGANVNTGSHRFTALAAAAYNDKLEMAKFLLAHGANVNVRPWGSWSPLMYAADAGNLDVVRLLLEHGADMQVRDEKGKTALGLAVEENHADVATLLRQHGAPQ
jgi:ankyrin repeat protein